MHHEVIKNHNYEGAKGRRTQFYEGSTSLKSCIQDGWWVKHPTSIKVLRSPPIYMGLGRYLPAILNTGLQDRAEALLGERQKRKRQGHVWGRAPESVSYPDSLCGILDYILVYW